MHSKKIHCLHLCFSFLFVPCLWYTYTESYAPIVYIQCSKLFLERYKYSWQCTCLWDVFHVFAVNVLPEISILRKYQNWHWVMCEHSPNDKHLMLEVVILCTEGLFHLCLCYLQAIFDMCTFQKYKALDSYTWTCNIWRLHMF